MLKKIFIFLIFSFVLLKADFLDKVVYVENLDDKTQKSIKEEFFNFESKSYTFTIATLNTKEDNPIEFFKEYKLKNALAYKFGENDKYTSVISGVYKNYDEAKKAFKNLDKKLMTHRPYIVGLKRHQKQFKRYNSVKVVSKNKAYTKIQRSKKITSNNQGVIYSNNTEKSQELKDELLKNGSRLYAVAIASIPKSSVENFLKNNNISDKSIAHVYGKDKANVRVIYGLYSNYKEAKKDIEKLNNSLKKNKPYAMKMKHFQNYFKKHNPNYNEDIIKLKVNEKKAESLDSKPQLAEEIKVLKPKKVKVVKKEPVKPKVVKKEPIKKIKKQVKEKKPKVQTREELNKNRFLKHSELENIYYIESEGEFNLLSEVFLNENSSFFTLDLGEIKLDDSTIEKFFIEQNLDNAAVAYKYGDKKEFARAIYGAYETKEAATKAKKDLNLNLKEIRVSNIKNHQKLYKMYHENILKSTPKNKVKKTKSKNKNLQSDIVFVEHNEHNSLKDEFSKKNSPYYTITLITFHKNDLTPKGFFKTHGIKDNALAFSLGSSNDYYRVVYGLFNTSKEAIQVIENLSYELLKNKPYVSKVKTSKRRFESYNSRIVRDYDAVKIELE